FNLQYENNAESRLKLQMTSGIFKTLQTYERVDAQGASEKKWIFRIPPCSSEKIGDVTGVTVSAQLGLAASRKYVTHAIFSGGKVKVQGDFVSLLRHLRASK